MTYEEVREGMVVLVTPTDIEDSLRGEFSIGSVLSNLSGDILRVPWSVDSARYWMVNSQAYYEELI